MNLPDVVSRDEWLVARKALLAEEKEFTKRRDALNTRRRELPMVLVDKPYVFTGPEGSVGLADLFEGRLQLVVYHFMFQPEWDAGCPNCTGFVDEIGSLEYLHGTNTTFALVSRAPYEKLAAYRAESAAKERAEAEVIADYLPEQLDGDEIARIVTEAVERTGAAGEGMKAMGKVMGVVQPQVKGRADGAAVSAEVRRQLGAG